MFLKDSVDGTLILESREIKKALKISYIGLFNSALRNHRIIRLWKLCVTGYVSNWCYHRHEFCYGQSLKVGVTRYITELCVSLLSSADIFMQSALNILSCAYAAFYLADYYCFASCCQVMYS